MINVEIEDPAANPDVRLLLEEHLVDMFATSPAESVHALDLDALRAPSVTFWVAREGGAALGCGALKDLGEYAAGEGEIKSMRTRDVARGRGVAQAVLDTIVREARSRGYTRLKLETGTQAFFEPAHRLYERNGFVLCEPFADYVVDPSSRFMSLEL
jgi:putative acetyltransferase